MPFEGIFMGGWPQAKLETPKMGSSPGSPHFQSKPPGGSEKRANCLFSFEKYKIPKEEAGNRPRQTGSHLPHTPGVAVGLSPQATRVAKSLFAISLGSGCPPSQTTHSVQLSAHPDSWSGRRRGSGTEASPSSQATTILSHPCSATSVYRPLSWELEKGTS